MKTKLVKAAVILGVLGASTLSHAVAGPMAANQETVVLVQNISGVDGAGNRQVLFSDKSGKAVPMAELVTLVSELNARKTGQVGVFKDIQLELADVRYAVQPNGLVLTEKKKGASTVALTGSIELTRSGTKSQGLELK